MKILFSTMLSIVLLLQVNLLAAQDTVKIFVNEKKAGQWISNTAQSVVSLKKIKQHSLKKITLRFCPAKEPSSAYAKSIEFSDSKETRSEVLEINESSRSQVSISGILTRLQFYKEKKINVFLLLNPANKMMMMPSRRITLGTLTLK